MVHEQRGSRTLFPGMKVVLLEDVDDVGRAGEIVEVSDGHARNYLFPEGLAALATPERETRAAATQAVEKKRAEEELARLQALVDALDQKVVAIRAPVGPTGKLHGAVTATDIRKALEKALERTLPEGVVHLQDPITEPGEQKLSLSFPHGLEAEVTLVVEGVLPGAAEKE